MKRLLLCLVLVAALALVAGCGAKKTSTGPAPTSTSHTPVTLTVWHLWTIASEKKGFTDAVAGFHKLYPWITLKLIPYPDASTFDQEVIKDTKAGIPPDVILSFGPDYVGQYASGGILAGPQALHGARPLLDGPVRAGRAHVLPVRRQGSWRCRC